MEKQKKKKQKSRSRRAEESHAPPPLKKASKIPRLDFPYYFPRMLTSFPRDADYFSSGWWLLPPEMPPLSSGYWLLFFEMPPISSRCWLLPPEMPPLFSGYWLLFFGWQPPLQEYLLMQKQKSKLCWQENYFFTKRKLSYRQQAYYSTGWSNRGGCRFSPSAPRVKPFKMLI